jgi:hypothetical protein
MATKSIKSRKTPRTKPAPKPAKFTEADRAELATRVAKKAGAPDPKREAIGRVPNHLWDLADAFDAAKNSIIEACGSCPPDDGNAAAAIFDALNNLHVGESYLEELRETLIVAGALDDRGPPVPYRFQKHTTTAAKATVAP